MPKDVRKCTVKGCEKEAYRSIAYGDFVKVKTELDAIPIANKVYLCKEHYKKYKRHVRKLKKFDKWRVYRL
ncbi:MAG: hypothetical protein DRJ51_02730 [Thermoprotei archaeon]|nr:MAG: hypothetical protein DRJ51_02730 [Thermoprotei archaeon]RLE82551.1 MAG: hypothetical protein DRJ36_00465 [Thermoprotei archaeon]